MLSRAFRALTRHTDVLVAVGVRPNSEIAKRAGLELGPGESIAVGRDLRTTDDMIFAAGDCADAFHVVTGKRVWVPLALRANRAGWAVAEVGRQPWIVYGLMKTADAASPIAASQVWVSLIGFVVLYSLLGAADAYLLFKYARKGPEPDPTASDQKGGLSHA